MVNDGTMREIETIVFDGMCDEFIEGYRFIPIGESWIREDGEVFCGSMVSPWKDYAELDALQRAYDARTRFEYEEALKEIEEALGV